MARMTTSRDMAHRFFNNPTERGEYANIKTKFTYWRLFSGKLLWQYYSYSAIIAKMVHGKNGYVCLVESCRYSVTTERHKSELINACPYDYIMVPDIDATDFGFGQLLRRYDKEFGENHNLFNRKEERTGFLTLIDRMNKFDQLVGLNTIEEKRDLRRLLHCVRIKRMIDLCNEKEQALNARNERIENMSDEQRAINRQKREEANKRKYERFISSEDIMFKLKTAFSQSYKRMYYRSNCKNDDMRNATKEYCNTLNSMRDSQGRRYSYVWIEGNHVKTSQHITVDLDAVKRLCRIWESGHNIIGMTISGYTIVENNKEVVKIGCHVIPYWNIVELCKAAV